MTLNEFYSRVINDAIPVDEKDAPESVQMKFERYLNDDLGELHPDDDREELWDNFCEYLANRQIQKDMQD